MERFSKDFLVGEESRKFEFTMMRNVQGIKFFIVSKDANQKPIAFSLKQKEGKVWKLLPGAPPWLYPLESQFSDAINETRLK